MESNYQKVQHAILPAQLTLIKSTTPYLAYIGGVRSGKTHGGALKALIICRNYPGIHGMVTAPSHNILDQGTIATYLRVFPRKYIRSFNRQTKLMGLTDGGQIFFRSTSEPLLLQGATLGWFHMDEAAISPVLAFQNLQARLSERIQSPEGKLIDTPMQGWVTSTPFGFNWVYLEFAQQERPNYELIQVRTRDNFLLPPELAPRLEGDYANNEEFALQQLEGRFIQVGGACPFDKKVLNAMYEEAKSTKVQDNEFGFGYIYHPRVIGNHYIIGADAATGGGDDDSAYVIAQLSPVSIDIVCCGCGKMPEAEFADILYKKSQDYNNAIIVVEDAPVGKATLQKLRAMEANLLKINDKDGVVTSGTTKPMFVANLAEAIKDRSLTIPHIGIIEQLISYIKNEKGKYGAVGGAHDDYVSALMMLIHGVREMPMHQEIEVINTLAQRRMYA